jgi:hypothetical protein
MSLDRTKAARVLALLASDQAGERDAAVQALGRLLKAANMRFEDLASAGGEVNIAHLTKLLAEQTQNATVWRTRAQAEARRSDELRTTSQTWGKRAVALERRVADLEARLELSAGENAKLRAALGHERAAQAILGDNPAVQEIRTQASVEPLVKREEGAVGTRGFSI